MHALIKDNAVVAYPYTLGDLKKDNPSTSFPKNPPEALLQEWGMEEVVRTNRPVVDHTKSVAEDTPALVENAWIQTWKVLDATTTEITKRTEAKSKQVRRNRDQLLSDSDWRVIKASETGTPMSQAWLDYRQALRDITDHANFPWLDDADWPVKPE